ncbi:IS1634 family transposase, partial [Psittacicella hinzii]
MTVLVDLPEKGITTKNDRRGEKAVKRVFKVIKSYRDPITKKPKVKETLIGKLDDETGKLIPNENYYKYYDSNNSSNYESQLVTELRTGDFQCLNVGFIGACFKLAKNYKLLQTLQQIFGKELAEGFLYLAIYTLENGSVMSYYPRWALSRGLDDKFTYSSREISRILQSISKEDKLDFLNSWFKIHHSDKYLAYNVTSISSYNQQMYDIARGYNRDGEDLPQINLGVIYDQDSRLPLYYDIYRGNIPDKAYLETTISLALSLNINKLNLVMDQGFYTKDNIKYLHSKGTNFLTLLPKNNKLYKELLNDVKANPYDFIKEYDIKYKIFARSYIKVNEGIKSKVIMSYSQAEHTYLAESLLDKVERNNVDLNLISNKRGLVVKKLMKYHEVKQEGDVLISYKEYKYKIHEEYSKMGYFALITNDLDLEPLEILS